MLLNRSRERATELAAKLGGVAVDWSRLDDELAMADLVVSTTGASAPVVDAARYAGIESSRGGRPLVVLDLAVPRDFDPAINSRPGVWLYSIEDLAAACEANRRKRQREIPAA